MRDPVRDARVLSGADRDEWQLLLRKLSGERASIRTAMAFALDHTAQAKEVRR